MKKEKIIIIVLIILNILIISSKEIIKVSKNQITSIEDKNITYTILQLDGVKITRVKMYKKTPFVEKTDKDKMQGE